ncbi:acyl carrier protein [Helicobacter marmotae]|uniref:Acyl carrier protein n=1 Tax=Helicobacter marmotae TaxID=152490 RepID=A0A3D8I6I4_9HELI|nr:acyl carrier protein [Helicobacter marmotae]RDU60763.1 acyl carrier protein [Helicobacter marmotae]
MQELSQKIYAILSNILEVPVNENTQVSMQNCPNWSSLAHIDIIMSIEESFNIAFKADELPYLNTQEALVRRVSELLS